MGAIEVVAFVLGAFLLVLALWDLFETIVVPRPTPGWFRIGRYLVRGSWRALRTLRDGRGGRSYDRVLGLFAPGATIALLAAWLVSLILGYGLLLFAVRDQLRPVPTNLGTTVYFAATSVLTLGFGDLVAEGPLARIIAAMAAITGLGVVALVVTFLFSLYGSYQRREVRVVMLQASAGAPPSAVALLETYAQLGLVEQLPGLFRDWQAWAAEVLDSHVAYPLLGFFRSSHDDLSWISALGTVLDASSLVLTTIEDLPRGDAKLFKRMGTHLVEDLSNLGFQVGRASGLDRSAFEA
ncbi:MAG: ion channel, partial [Candidatus Limnocylindrales bacterium]